MDDGEALSSIPLVTVRLFLPPASAVEVIESVPCVHLSICLLVSAFTTELFDVQYGNLP